MSLSSIYWLGLAFFPLMVIYVNLGLEQRLSYFIPLQLVLKEINKYDHYLNLVLFVEKLGKEMSHYKLGWQKYI